MSRNLSESDTSDRRKVRYRLVARRVNGRREVNRNV
jgi:hypothetical protein